MIQQKQEPEIQSWISKLCFLISRKDQIKAALCSKKDQKKAEKNSPKSNRAPSKGPCRIFKIVIFVFKKSLTRNQKSQQVSFQIHNPNSKSHS